MGTYRKLLIWLCAYVVVLTALFLSFWQVGRAPLWDYDESTYAQIAHEALVEGPILAPHFMGVPFFEKPPLYMWLAEGSARVFGESEWSLRLPSVLLGVLSVLVVMFLAFELSGNVWAGLLAGAILTTTAPFIETARQVRLDVPVAFFVTLAAYGFVRGLRDGKWFTVFGIAVALAALTKSVVAVFALAAVPVFSFWIGDFSWIKNKYFWMGVGAGFVVLAPWHIYQTLHFGSVFWRDYVGINVTLRFNQELFNMVKVSNYDYVWYLSNFANPWTQVFVLGVVPVATYWHLWPKRVRAGMGACSSLLLCIVFVFFAAATKAPTYLIPLYPFGAVAISLAILGVMERMSRPNKAIVCVSIFLCLCIGLWSTVYNGFHRNLYYSQTDQLSAEEKMVAIQLLQKPRATWFVYGGDREVGSIMYYTQNIRPISLAGAEHPKVGDEILLYASQHEQFFHDYGSLSTTVQYPGQQLLLLQVVSED